MNTHGHRKSKKKTTTYNSWQSMKRRCYDQNHDNYRYYGARGIKVCTRWQTFDNFLEDMGERPLNKTLDRINPNGNYSPDNCRWADASTQGLNKRRTKNVDQSSKA